MKILVVGAGGVGGYFGARLIQAGFDVTTVARGAHGRALSRDGLWIRAEGGEEHVEFRWVVERLDELNERFHLVLLAIKSKDLNAVAVALPDVLREDGCVVPLLNGLDSEHRVASLIGASRTIASVAYMSAGILVPGRIYVHGNTRVGLAPYTEGQEERIDALEQVFSRAGIPVQRSPKAATMLWQKMVWNAPFNAICGLLNKSAGEALDVAETLVRDAMNEVVRVANLDGADLPDDMATKMIAVTRSQFPRTEPSMLQDLRAGRRTEVEVLQEAVIQRGKTLGVDTPIMTTLAALIRGAENPR